MPIRLERIPAALVAAWLLFTLPVGGGEAAARAEAPQAFLARTFELSKADLGRIDEGRVYSRTLDASGKREVATLGIVRVAITPEFYTARLADIANFKKDEAVLQIGTFANPPRPSDVRTLTLEPSEVRSLRKCRVTDCDMQLPADAIERFRSAVDWDAADAEAQGNAVIRAILVDYVARYRASGGLALMTYADESQPIAVGAALRELIEGDAQVLTQFPELRGHLVAPFAGNAAIVDLIYWSKEKVARKEVVSVTHLATVRPSGSPVAYAVASKQIYASHYFDASLGLTLLIRDGAAASPATYIVYVNRSSVDALDGLFGALARRLVRSRARSTVAKLLEGLKVRLERDFASAGRGPAGPPPDGPVSTP